MDFQDIVMSEFKTEDVECLDEGWFPITPLLAYSTFKKKIFTALNNNKVLQTFKKVGSGEVGREVKGKVLATKEKIRHDVGIAGKNEDNTVYKLTPEQVSVLADITNKYGKKLLNEIYIFRKNVLAPYQVIKRLVKQNKQVSFKDRFGMSYEEYKSALESGRRKIEKRKDYLENTKGKTEKIDEHNLLLDRIQQQIDDISKGKGELSDSILNKIYQELEIGDSELQGYTLAELKSVTDELSRNYRDLRDYIASEGESLPPEDVIAKIERNIEIRSGKIEGEEADTEKIVKEVSIKSLKKGNINIALAKYMLRKEVRDKIKEVDNNSYKKMYLELLKSLAQKLHTRKKDILSSAIGDKLAIEFTEKEKRIWGKLFSTKGDFSGNLEDYYQKITDESLKDVRHVEKPEALLHSQQQIENEIKRFERKLAKVIDPEDLAKLKKYRLINNLITIKEMKDPESLFKSPADFKQVSVEDADTTDDETNDGEPKDNEEEDYTSESEFVRKLKELSTMEFDTMNELNNAKKQIDELVKKMNAQGDQKIVQKYEDVIRQFHLRRTTNKQETTGNKFLYGEVTDIDMVENYARKMLKTKYANIDEIKQDKIIFDKLVEKYKKEDPEAERNLQEINFLLGQVDRKLEGALGRYYGED